MQQESLTNQLAREKSPYLRQHRDNPVAWSAWNDEAFALAKRLDRPIFLSIGYATCHWCHVMEGDSFENHDIAQVLNRAFVSVKVDREELPDVDAFYMSALQAQTGQGGWPLSAFLTPEGKPFWMATFIPRDRFNSILEHVEELWKSDKRPDLTQAAEALTNHVNSPLRTALPSDDELPLKAWRDGFLASCEQRFDDLYGGFSGAPKFPPSLTLMALCREGSDVAKRMVALTCDAMIRGGIHDHIGGGFHRYATDAEWMVPHFEKMLYDNALLPLALLEAFVTTGKHEYAWSAERALAYVERDLLDPKTKAFFSAEDADSEKCEGKFYLWRFDDLQSLLSADEMGFLLRYYALSPEGNFEVDRRVGDLERAAGLSEFHHGNIFHLPPAADFTHKQHKEFAQIVDKLFKEREKRVRPLRDEKIIVSWNALMISTFATAAIILNEPRYAVIAENALQFLLNHLYADSSLKRRYCDGEVRFAAVLEDYAYLVKALLDLYKATLNTHWLVKAKELQAAQDEQFWDESVGSYLDAKKANMRFEVKQRELHDHAIPSANAIACLNLLALSDVYYESAMREKAHTILQQVGPNLSRYPQAFSSFFLAINHRLKEGKVLVIAPAKDGCDERVLLQAKRASVFSPLLTVVTNTAAEADLPGLNDKPSTNGQTTYYLCRWGLCEKPSHNFEEVLASLEA